MVNLDGLFGKLPQYAEQLDPDVEAAIHELVQILAGPAQESRTSRTFTCDDVAEILRGQVMPGQTSPLMREVIELYAEILEHVQHSSASSIGEEIRSRLPLMKEDTIREIFERMSNTPDMYDWIKTDSL